MLFICATAREPVLYERYQVTQPSIGATTLATKHEILSGNMR